MDIQNTYDVLIKIDGKDIFTEYPCEFLNAHIYEGIESIVPTCAIALAIHGMALESLPFVDGSKIEITITSKAYGIDNKYTFRLYDINGILQDGWTVGITLSGILDFYDGYLQGNTLNTYGTTSEIFSKIANKYQLEKDIDTTNDKQLWVAGENNLYQFMTYMTQHAYIDEKSAMFWCFNGQKKLLFKNILGIFSREVKNAFTFMQSIPYDEENKTYRYVSADASITAGTNNIFNQGYGGSDYYFNLLDYNMKEAFSKFVIAENRMINISKELSKGLANEMLPFDVGNFHEKYFDAYKQNRRIMSTFSTSVFLKTDCLQNFKLAEIVKLVYMDNGDQNLALNPLCGNYIISNIHTVISKQSVVAALQLTTQGLNTKSQTVETY